MCALVTGVQTCALPIYAQAVMAALTKRGERDVRLLDFRDFPARMAVDMRLTSSRQSRFAIRFPDGRVVDMANVKSVWWRRPQTFGLPEDRMRPEVRQFAMQAAATAFQGLWQVSQEPWFNEYGSAAGRERGYTFVKYAGADV